LCEARSLHLAIAMTGGAGRVVPGMRVGDYRLGASLEAAPGELAFAAVHLVLPRHAVIHTPAEPAEDAAVALLRRAWILEALRHPAVPRMYECGRLPGSIDRCPWIAVEPVAGPTVDVLSPREVVALIADLAGVLAHAHATDVTHRGVRTSAIVRAAAGFRLADWTAAGVGGDRAADLRALGAVAYRALTRADVIEPTARRCRAAPRRLARLIDSLVGATPPSAADVCAETRVLADELAYNDDGTPIEEVDVVLVDISRDPPPVPRVKWTPAGGVIARTPRDTIVDGKKAP
jgi:eukaryotic-like serine/threonine-protein kinase